MAYGIIRGGIATGTNLPEMVRRQLASAVPRLRFVRGIPRAPSASVRASEG